MSKDIALIGYDCDFGATVAGTAAGPQALRDRGLVQRLADTGRTVRDCGDVSNSAGARLSDAENSLITPDEQKCRYLSAIYAHCRELQHKTRTALDQGLLPFVIGGDHSLAIGSTAAVSNYYTESAKRIGLIWIDTHADFNTPETSPSKRIFGMSTAVLSGHVPGLLSSLQQTFPGVAEKNIAYVGLRDIDPAERTRLNNAAGFVSTIKDIDIHGIAAVIEKAMASALDGTCGFVVSFDIDVCDSNLMPGTGTPSRGGLTFREAHCALELLYDSGRLLSFEIAELNPLLDKNFQTVDIAISFIESAAGKAIF